MSARTSPQDPSTLYEDAQSSVEQHLTSLKSHLYTQFSLWDAYFAAEKAKAASLKEEVVMLRKEIQKREEMLERSCCSCRTRPNWDVSLEEASTEVDFDSASPTSVYSPHPVAEEADSRVEKMDDSARKPKRQRES